MNKTPLVSLLLLNWNGIEFTRKCIRSLLKTNYPNFEIILVDNGSRDNEGERLISEFGKMVKIILQPVNIGYAEGMNIAYRRAIGDYIMLLNNDMEFTSDWLLPLVRILQKNPFVGACQPKIKDVKNKNIFEYAAAAGGFIDFFGYPFARGRVFSKVEIDTGQYENQIKICWAGVLLIRRSILKKIGLFDPIYFNYAEDVDLCLRIYSQGYLIVYIPNSIVYHFGGGVLNKNLFQKMYFIHRNHLILIVKNWEAKKLLFFFPLRLSMEFISFFYYLLTGYPMSALSVIKALLSVLFMTKRILLSRFKYKKYLNSNNLSNMPMYKGSIVWDYFILRKQKFSSIMKSDMHGP
ncbi:glycosyltransferase family 2 protein [Candidatus Gottesmanbacteria bacterium]|nr:glycosyltransferase family 2 protein [Candidatus Gottesmanbacteria bacterium]